MHTVAAAAALLLPPNMCTHPKFLQSSNMADAQRIAARPASTISLPDELLAKCFGLLRWRTGEPAWHVGGFLARRGSSTCGAQSPWWYGAAPWAPSAPPDPGRTVLQLYTLGHDRFSDLVAMIASSLSASYQLRHLAQTPHTSHQVALCGVAALPKPASMPPGGHMQLLPHPAEQLSASHSAGAHPFGRLDGQLSRWPARRRGQACY